MPKVTEKTAVDKEDVCEIIELASADIETLARAFDVINEVCQEFSHPYVSLNRTLDKRLIN